MGQGTADNEPRYDLLIAGGEVIDPASALNGRLDVAVLGDKIADVAPRIDPRSATRVIDAAGQVVTPGLVDLHTHVYWGVTYWGIEPDPVAARTGVTTWLDVGSAGGYSFPGFRRYVAEPSRARIFAFLNLSSIGLIAPTWEFANLDYCDLGLAADIVDRHRDLILGIKARIDRNTTRGTGIRPLMLARELADRVNLPLMVHIGSGPPSLDEVADHLRPGDILTHCCTGGDMRLLGQDGVPHAHVRRLQEAGLVLDVGHGTGSFSFDVAEGLLAHGVVPDVISSDIHQLAVQGPMFDLPTTLSKFLSLGLSLPEVIERATSRPAAAMRRPDLGGLRPGSIADLAIFRLEEGHFLFHDVAMAPRRGTKRLVNTQTIVGGQLLPPQPELAPQPWAVLPAHQRTVLSTAAGE